MKMPRKCRNRGCKHWTAWTDGERYCPTCLEAIALVFAVVSSLLLAFVVVAAVAWSLR